MGRRESDKINAKHLNGTDMEYNDKHTDKMAENSNNDMIETDGGDLTVPPVNFQMSVSSAEDNDPVEPTDVTPMIASQNGKLKYQFGDMEVIEVVSVVEGVDVE